MASHLADYKVYQIQITKDFGSAQFKNNMKDLFAKIAQKKENTTFIFSDNEITDEGIIEDINNILNLGEIPNLFDKKEGKDEFAPIRDKLRDKNKRETDEKIYDNFLSIIQGSLHISFCMSQSGSNLRTYSRQYPGLINNTTQIWFTDWPREALIQVATHYLSGKLEVELPSKEDMEHEEEADGEEDDKGSESGEEEEDPEVKRAKEEEAKRVLLQKIKNEKVMAMSNYFGDVHLKIVEYADKMRREMKREYFVTPKNYIDFVKEFHVLAERKKAQITKQLNKYNIGLERLNQAQEGVGVLKIKMDTMNIEARKKKKKLDTLIRELKSQSKNVNADREKLNAKTDEIKIKAEETEKLRLRAKEDLDKVEPLLKKAEAKVEELKEQKSYFDEIKGCMRKKQNFPLMVQMIKSIFILMEEAPTDSNIDHVMAHSFIKKITSIDIKKIAENKSRYEKFEDMTRSIALKPGTIGSISILDDYIKAVGNSIKATKDVQPILDNLRRLDGILKALDEERIELASKLQSAESKESQLKNEQDSTKMDLEIAEKEVLMLEARLERAEDLVKGLENSRDSWTQNSINLAKEKKMIDGNVMMSVALLNYFGPFQSEYREELKKYLFTKVLQSGIKYDPTWDFIQFIGKDIEVLQWTFKGLPSDQFSKENGVIVMNTSRFPLMIDPQGQANIWLKNMYGDECEKLDPTTKDLATKLKGLIMIGAIGLLQNIDEDIDPSIDPVLSKQLKVIEGKSLMMFGDQQIPYDPNFKFYMTTKLSNPTYRPEISTKVTIVNFSVKQKGLEEQLLEELLKIMNQKLEETRVESIMTKATNEDKLIQLEDDILKMIEESKVDLVDDIELINTLKTSRETEESVTMTIANSKLVIQKNQIARENYRPLGFVGSILYFTIYNLSQIDHMYQFSLDSYVDLFKKVVNEKKDERGGFGGASEVIKEKIEAIDEGLRKAVYDYACRGIFEKDKLLLSLQITVAMAPIDEKNAKEKEESGDDKNKKKGRKNRKKAAEEEEDEEKQGEKKKNLDYYAEFFRDEWNIFLKGGVVLNRDNQIQNPDSSWITQAMWDNITELDNMPNFQGIAGSFTHTTKDWKRFYASDQPEIEPLPSDWGTKIKDFSILVLLRAIRPDRISPGTKNYVKKNLGEKFIKPPMFDIAKIYEDTTSTTP